MLIRCPECKQEVSDSARKCPHCGYGLRSFWGKPSRAKTILAVIVLVTVVLSIALPVINKTTDWLHPERVTAQEFHRIKSGMSYQEVRQIVGDDHRSYKMVSDTEYVYTYRGVGEEDCVVTIYFVNGRVEWKQHTGLLGESLTKGMQIH